MPTQPDFARVAGEAFDSDQNLPAMLLAACRHYAERPAFTNLGRTLSFGEVEHLSDDLASYLLHGLGLANGERVAVMLPNLLQFPVAVLGVLRADLIAVLVNPLYTARELHHQLADSGAAALIVLDNFGAVATEALDNTSVRHVITTRVGDPLPWPKSLLVDTVLKHVKKAIPPFHFDNAVRWLKAAGCRACRRTPLPAIPHSCNTPVAPRACPRAPYFRIAHCSPMWPACWSSSGHSSMRKKMWSWYVCRCTTLLPTAT